MNQKEIISWWCTTFGSAEEAALMRAFTGGNISQGPVVVELERELSDYLQVSDVVAVTNGSSALALALLADGIGPGDEVIVPSQTWIATAHAVSLIGATPIFVDSRSDLPIMDVALVEEKITQETRAVIPVHLNGRSVQMPDLQELASQHELLVIEDAAQALGSRGSDGALLGTSSFAGCFSLSVTKVISSGQGGFIALRDASLANRIRRMRTHGVENVKDVASWSAFGFNFRFPDVLAAIALAQVPLIEARLARLQVIRDSYSAALEDVEGIRVLPLAPDERGPYVEAVCDERNALMTFLANVGIETRRFYPAVDSAPYYKSGPSSPNAQRFAEKGLYLPSGPSQDDGAIERTLQAIMSYFRRGAKTTTSGAVKVAGNSEGIQ